MNNHFELYTIHVKKNCHPRCISYSITFVQVQTYERNKLGVKATLSSVAEQIEVLFNFYCEGFKAPESKTVIKESLSVIKKPGGISV